MTGEDEGEEVTVTGAGGYQARARLFRDTAARGDVLYFTSTPSWQSDAFKKMAAMYGADSERRMASWTDALAKMKVATAAATDALTGVGLAAEAALFIAPGLSWPTMESADWAWGEMDRDARWDISGVKEFWLETKETPGAAGGYGKAGTQRSGPGVTRQHRWRRRDGTWCWAGERASAKEVERSWGWPVPEAVARAENETAANWVEKAADWQRVVDSLQHEGEVTLGGAGKDWSCAGCGAVSADRELFGEMGEVCGGGS